MSQFKRDGSTELFNMIGSDGSRCGLVAVVAVEAEDDGSFYLCFNILDEGVEGQVGRTIETTEEGNEFVTWTGCRIESWNPVVSLSPECVPGKGAWEHDTCEDCEGLVEWGDVDFTNGVSEAGGRGKCKRCGAVYEAGFIIELDYVTKTSAITDNGGGR